MNISIRIEKSTKPSPSPLHTSLSTCSSERHQGLQSVQFSCSVMSDSATPWTTARQSVAGSQSLLKLMSIESVMPSNRLVLYCPLLLPPSIFPSIRVFSDESVLRIR